MSCNKQEMIDIYFWSQIDHTVSLRLSLKSRTLSLSLSLSCLYDMELNGVQIGFQFMAIEVEDLSPPVAMVRHIFK